MSNEPKEIMEIGPDEVVVKRYELAAALEQLDMVRLVLHRELERLPDTRVMDRGTDSIGSWSQRNDENAYGGWPVRDRNLLAAFEQTWGLSEFLAINSEQTVLGLDELKKQGSWLLVEESQDSQS